MNNWSSNSFAPPLLASCGAPHMGATKRYNCQLEVTRNYSFQDTPEDLKAHLDCAGVAPQHLDCAGVASQHLGCASCAPQHLDFSSELFF